MRAHHLSVLGLLLFCTAPALAPPPAPVRPGVEVLLADSLHLITGKRFGLLTNHTGVDRLGHRDADLLRAAPGARLTVLFSPEHGFRGLEDRPGLPDGVDSATGLPIYSLYGGSRLAARASRRAAGGAQEREDRQAGQDPSSERLHRRYPFLLAQRSPNTRLARPWP